jgi:hypothetical protein
MNTRSIADIYAANESTRHRLKATVADIPPELAASLPDGEKWTIAQIVEHIAIVNGGAARICRRLLTKAQGDGRTSDGDAVFGDGFAAKTDEIANLKVEAPEVVRPTGEISISESLAALDANDEIFREIRPMFETCHSPEYTFPHPFFGEISAAEWLVIAGGHEARHTKQIKRRLENSG